MKKIKRKDDDQDVEERRMRASTCIEYLLKWMVSHRHMIADVSQPTNHNTVQQSHMAGLSHELYHPKDYMNL